MMSTTFQNEQNISRKWYHVNADGQIVGRLAVKIAAILMGKTKPIYTPNVDCGDYVVVTGVEGLRLSGRKEQQKVYRHHTGFAGGMKETTFLNMRQRHPDKILRLAVQRMLPKNRLSYRMLDKLKIYRGTSHPHLAQKPLPLD